MLGKPRGFGIEAIAIRLGQVILFAFGESGLPGKGRLLKARVQRRWCRRRFCSTWPAIRCNIYHTRREINLTRTQCAVRLPLSPAIPVKPYTVIAGLSLPLAIHTYWLSLVAFDFAAFARPAPITTSSLRLWSTSFLRPWHGNICEVAVELLLIPEVTV